MTSWRKLGTVIRPDPDTRWGRTHAMLPTPEQVDGSLWRIWWGGRNDQNQSHIGWSLIDLEKPDVEIDRAAQPALAPGALGTFDDNGVLPSCVINTGDETRLYYIGFKPGGTTRMDLYGGLAIRAGTATSFERWSQAPILERNRVNPYINTAPWVVRTPIAWRMYYVAGVEWVHPDLPRYNIQIASSKDGLDWQRDGRVAIDFEPGENALARPYVWHDGETWRMWFAAKGEAYRLREAVSSDGLNWTRTDPPGLEPGDGEDSDMVEYAIVLSHGGQRIVFYNGNDYGKGGVLAAIEE
ncbi:hypothetical protein [Hyphobacterium sp.]|uniref:hypothetical protein n=1 Tax=Hyphobacterium sp. TaxID=2004662 RepID=UPI003BAD456F